MRRLIVCCDGTWNTPKDEAVTNVRRLANALDDRDEEGNLQLSYYQPGVGTEGRMLTRLLGASVGVGLSHNVLDAYHWLATGYEPGDRIALFGFSRGAYTARSLAGMISAGGLIETVGMVETVVWRWIQRIYDQRYRRHDTARWRKGLDFRFDPDRPGDIPVDFIGVWDTVGALGIPDYLGGLDALDPVHRYDFHDVTLNPHVRYARHAVAMDERRSPYTPALWAEPYAPGQDVKQVWFPGSHKNVGGGHVQTGLSDGALLWMIGEARATAGIGFATTTVEQVAADSLDVLHDDDLVGGVLQPLVEPTIRPWLEILLQPQPRAVPRIDPDVPDPSIHASVYERHLTASITGGRYRPTRVLIPGESASVEVYADRPWNETGLYLEAGEYDFIADGEWRDGDIPSGPAGTTGLARLNPLSERARLLGTLSSRFTTLFRRVTGNSAADFLGARREVDLPWMSLVAVVANNASMVNGRRPAHERIVVGVGTRRLVTRGGYLYAYANDAWGQYANNQGSVRLEVKRLLKPEQEASAGARSRRAVASGPRKRAVSTPRAGRVRR